MIPRGAIVWLGLLAALSITSAATTAASANGRCTSEFWNFQGQCVQGCPGADREEVLIVMDEGRRCEMADGVWRCCRVPFLPTSTMKPYDQTCSQISSKTSCLANYKCGFCTAKPYQGPVVSRCVGAGDFNNFVANNKDASETRCTWPEAPSKPQIYKPVYDQADRGCMASMDDASCLNSGKCRWCEDLTGVSKPQCLFWRPENKLCRDQKWQDFVGTTINVTVSSCSFFTPRSTETKTKPSNTAIAGSFWHCIAPSPRDPRIRLIGTTSVPSSRVLSTTYERRVGRKYTWNSNTISLSHPFASYTDRTPVTCYLTNSEKQNEADLAKRFVDPQMVFVVQPSQLVKKTDGTADPFISDPFEADESGKALFYRLVQTPAPEGSDATIWLKENPLIQCKIQMKVSSYALSPALKSLLQGGYAYSNCIEVRQGSPVEKKCLIANRCTQEWIVKYSYKRVESGMDLVTGLKMKVGEVIDQDSCNFIDWVVVQRPGAGFV